MKRPKSSVIGTVLFIIFFLATGGLGYYLYQSSTELVRQRQVLANLRQEYTDMDILTKQLNEAKPKISEISKSLPLTTIDVASFLQDVNASASISGAEVALRVSDVKKDQKVKDETRVEVQITVTGSYVNSTKFINRISGLPYYFLVRNISIKPNRQGTLDTVINVYLITQYNET